MPKVWREANQAKMKRIEDLGKFFPIAFVGRNFQVDRCYDTAQEPFAKLPRNVPKTIVQLWTWAPPSAKFLIVVPAVKIDSGDTRVREYTPQAPKFRALDMNSTQFGPDLEVAAQTMEEYDDLDHAILTCCMKANA